MTTSVRRAVLPRLGYGRSCHRSGDSAAPPLGAGGTFWEPGGDPIHYQDGNAPADARTRFVVAMMCAPGKPMLELVEEEEPEQRAHLRAPRPTD
ncbi:cupin domain-containing protein [Streptomyces mirabilis]|uniref:hypothetical protein n=1 Tax=Streptomyces mirabilis TaxID=68239 RepID=UPI0037152B97